MSGVTKRNCGKKFLVCFYELPFDDVTTTGADGGVGIPFTDKLLNSGNRGGAGIPANSAGSGTGMFSGRGIVNIGASAGDGASLALLLVHVAVIGDVIAAMFDLGMAPVPKKGAPEFASWLKVEGM